jgi:hypothetical protein
MVKSFATANKLQAPKTDTDGTAVIFGRTGQLFEYDNSQLGVIYSNPKDLTSQRWNTFRGDALKAGMELIQHGDREGSLAFDPKDRLQTRIAIKGAGVKRKRVMSEAQKASLELARAARAV